MASSTVDAEGGAARPEGAAAALPPEPADTRSKSTARGAAGLLLVAGKLPLLQPAPADGVALDPSPLRGLPAKQREARLVGLLELFASYGDAGAAAEALRYWRWRREMKDGRPAQRLDATVSGTITVVDTLSAPPGTPLPAPRKPVDLSG